MPSDKARDDIERSNAPPLIPMRRNRMVREAVDMAIHTLRNMAKRCFDMSKTSRRLATRHDKTADRSLSFIETTCISLSLRHLSI